METREASVQPSQEEVPGAPGVAAAGATQNKLTHDNSLTCILVVQYNQYHIGDQLQDILPQQRRVCVGEGAYIEKNLQVCGDHFGLYHWGRYVDIFLAQPGIMA